MQQQQQPPPQNQPPSQHHSLPPHQSQHHLQQHQGQPHHAAVASGLQQMLPTMHPLQQTGPQLMPQPSAPVSTEHIQKCLDENKQLILAILENQNLGKLQECAQFQAQLQRNLLYLAAIADAQPPVTPPRPQMVPNAHMQQGGIYMQQPSGFPPRASLHFNPQQLQEQQQQQQMHRPPLIPMQNPMGMRSAINNGMLMMHTEGASGTGLPVSSNHPDFGRGGTSANLADGRGSKQDAAAAQESGSAEQRDSVTDSRGGNGEPKDMS